MSIPAGIDRDAPVSARHEIDIDAPLEIVWRHTKFDSWPSWQTDITAGRVDGAFQAGGSFEWTLRATAESERRQADGRGEA